MLGICIFIHSYFPAAYFVHVLPSTQLVIPFIIHKHYEVSKRKFLMNFRDKEK